jgi:hypothetical protein
MRVTHILELPLLNQHTGHECGNTCLAAVAQYFRKPYSAKDIGELAGTKDTGTDHANMIAGACAIGATVFAKDRGTRTELEEFISRGLPIVVGWWSMWPPESHGERANTHFDSRWLPAERKAYDCGHYAVIHGTTPTGFKLMDPQDGYGGAPVGFFELTYEEWDAVWYDTDGDDYERVMRWYMVMNFEGRRFAGEYKGGRDHAPKRGKRVKSGR